MFIESHLAWTVERLMILEHKIENTIGSVGMTPASFGQVMGDMKNIEKKVSCILMNVCNVKLKSRFFCPHLSLMSTGLKERPVILSGKLSYLLTCVHSMITTDGNHIAETL